MEVKGIILISSQELLIKNYGQEKWEAVLSKLNKDDQSLFSDNLILPSKNYNIKTYRSLCLAIQNIFTKDYNDIFEEIGAYSAKKVVLELYKPLFNSRKNNPAKMFSTITKAISLVSPEKWETINIDSKQWEIRCKSDVFKNYYDMIDPICKRNTGGVKALLKGIGYKNISCTSKGIYSDKEHIPYVELLFKWD